jgi:hypothetical protein
MTWRATVVPCRYKHFAAIIGHLPENDRKI